MSCIPRHYRRPAPLPEMGFWHGVASTGNLAGEAIRIRALRPGTFADDYARMAQDHKNASVPCWKRCRCLHAFLN